MDLIPPHLIFFVTGLVLLAPMSWLLQYYYSYQSGLLDSFKDHWMCYRGDWIFIPINALFLFSVHISSAMYVFFLFSILLNLFPHFLWGYENKKFALRLHFYDINTARLNGAGIVHFIFSVIETTILFGAIFLTPVIPTIFLFLFLILFFGFILLYCSYRMHRRITHGDIIIGGGVILLVAFKVLLLTTVL